MTNRWPRSGSYQLMATWVSFSTQSNTSRTGVSASAVSHHLRVLRALRLVRHRRESRMTYYALDDEHIDLLFRTGLDHVRE